MLKKTIYQYFDKIVTRFHRWHRIKRQSDYLIRVYHFGLMRIELRIGLIFDYELEKPFIVEPVSSSGNPHFVRIVGRLERHLENDGEGEQT